MATTKITRKTIVGFGYTSACENDERGNLRVCDTTAPYHTGTIKTVCEKMQRDRELQSYRSGGTYYTSAWFVKVDGQWRKITDPWFNSMADSLYYKTDGQYHEDEIDVEIE